MKHESKKEQGKLVVLEIWTKKEISRESTKTNENKMGNLLARMERPEIGKLGENREGNEAAKAQVKLPSF